LKKYGTKMQALRDGTLTPCSSQQKHFVDVCIGLVEPEDKYERAWKSYLSTLAEEKRLSLVHQERLREAQRAEQHSQSLCFGDNARLLEPVQSLNQRDGNNINQDHTRPCPSCRGQGMNRDGDGCDRCNSRGYLNAH
jgi:hypothetical protein